MEYKAFYIKNYRAIREEVYIDISKNSLVPIIGINESGKSTILEAILAFDFYSDTYHEARHLKNLESVKLTV